MFHVAAPANTLMMNGTIRDDDAMSPEYGRRLLPVELDRIAKADPGRPYFARPRNTTNLAVGFEDISYRRVVIAVKRTAHWLERELGKPKDFDTIAYLAAPDFRNVLLALAVSKVGFKASSVSPGGIGYIGFSLYVGSCCFFPLATAFKAISIFSIRPNAILSS